MRVLVTGGRDYHDDDHIWNILTELNLRRGPITCIIHGAATGADTQAMLWAQMMDGCSPTRHVRNAPFVADWRQYGKSAGPIRNARMIAEGKPDLVVAFPGSRGTADMVRRAKDAGIEVIEVKAREPINVA